MANLKNGSSGSEVKKLQETLISKGYDVGSTGADGVLGKNTEAAIKQYQKDNGLAVDGIAGKNTLGKLYRSGNANGNAAGNDANAGKAKADPAAPAAPSGATPVTSPGGVTYGDFTYDSFAPSENVQQANALLAQNSANRPGAWVDPYQSQYMGYLNQYENRDPFSYDFNSDALYQQYKDNYIQQGQMAMMDTMGQAAAMTGGYGNSYAQTVGQQAYNQQLGQLNDIMPELYGMAYDRYQQEGQEMLNMYNLYKGLSDQSFDRYQGELDNWYREDARLTDNYNTLYDREHGDWELGYSTAWDEYLTGRSEAFTADQNAKNQAWQTEEAEKDRQHTSDENKKSREFTADENTKDREAAALKATAESPYGTLDTTDTMTWIKKFEDAEDLDALEAYTNALQGIIGPEAAAIWYDTYAKKFKDEEVVYPHNYKIYEPGAGGGGGGGTMYNAVR